MNHSFAILAISFVLSVISIAIVIFVTRKFNIYDQFDERKIHTEATPRLGGIGIFTGFVLGLLMYYFSGVAPHSLPFRMWLLIAGCALIFFMGVWDDLKPWRARYKFLTQCLAAILVLAGGFTFRKITFGPLNFAFSMGWFSVPLTFCWIIGVTNAVNLIDGLDGLAGTIATLVAVTYAFFFLRYGNEPAMMVCLILAVSVSGFLVFNLPFPRAKIFMGDGGSQFLGFVLSVLPLISAKNGMATIALPYAAAVLIIPVFDTIAAIWRRVREKRGILDPDRFHLHHKLLMLGFSKRQTLVVVACFQFVLSLFISVSGWTGGLMATVLLFAVYLLGLLFFTVIHVRKEGLLKEEEIAD